MNRHDYQRYKIWIDEFNKAIANGEQDTSREAEDLAGLNEVLLDALKTKRNELAAEVRSYERCHLEEKEKEK